MVVRIDHFGNIITNIAHTGKKQYKVTINNKSQEIDIYDNYEKAKEKPFLIEGSYKTLEIYIKNGSASEHFNIKPGDKLTIE